MNILFPSDGFTAIYSKQGLGSLRQLPHIIPGNGFTVTAIFGKPVFNHSIYTVFPALPICNNIKLSRTSLQVFILLTTVVTAVERT